MTGNAFDRERRYGLAMCQVKRMLASGLITAAESKETAARFREKYRPVAGSILVETQLLCTENRVINGNGKEGFPNEENQYSGACRASV